MRPLITAVLVLCAVSLGSARLASAQDERREQAKEFFRAGEQSYQASQYGVAAQAFEEAYSILAIPAIAFSTAQAYRLQFFVDQEPRGLKRAIELYRAYIAAVEQGGRRQDAVTSLAELEPILLRLEAQQEQVGKGPIEAARTAARTHIMVTSSVQDAVVRLDGGDPLPIPMDKDVPAGDYRVQVSADGYFPYDEVRKVSEGQFHLVPVQLTEKPAHIDVRGESGASVSVDGRPVGVLPMQRPLQLSAGTHIITVSERGHHSWSREVTLERGEEEVLRPSLARTRQRKLSYWLGGSAVVVLGAGALYGAAAIGSNRDARELEEERQETGLDAVQFQAYEGAVEARDQERTRAFGLIAAGGILAVTSALLYLVDMPGLETGTNRAKRLDSGPTEDNDGLAPMVLVPSVSPESAGLALRGRF